jgi:uncharacterized repeat protein (TIGR03803 family)
MRTFIRTLAIAGAVLASAASASQSSAANFKVLHSFCKKVLCGDGYNPQQALAQDEMGNLYGTAMGGAHRQGIVFELAAPAEGSKRWRYKVLYHFCALQNCSDGSDPTQSTLIADNAGNVYGTTFGGGRGNDTGTIFELSPPAKGHQWALHTIYSFCVRLSSCRDGANPAGGLTYAGREGGIPYDGVSPLYGTTAGGGGRFGGVAYSLTPKAGGGWSEKVLYAFCHEGGQGCTDGDSPIQQLTMDAPGALYGMTSAGGANKTGVAFRLSGFGTQVTESVLYDLCSGCASLSGLAIDSSGNLFGSVWYGGGGSDCNIDIGCGFVFEIASDETVSVPYQFCMLPSCSDGIGPIDGGGLFVDSSGAVYGTAKDGGARIGNVFKLSGTTLQNIHDFCVNGNCADGGAPFGAPIMSPSGQLFGVTILGGAYDGGTVWELSP